MQAAAPDEEEAPGPVMLPVAAQICVPAPARRHSKRFPTAGRVSHLRRTPQLARPCRRCTGVVRSQWVRHAKRSLRRAHAPLRAECDEQGSYLDMNNITEPMKRAAQQLLL